MEEKTIIKSERLSGIKFLSVGAVTGFIFALIIDFAFLDLSRGTRAKLTNFVPEIVIMALVIFAAFYVVYLGMKKCELTVTDKRVYGSAMFGRRVDLPLDMINAVATSAGNGIAVTTASGAIKFLMIVNKDEIHKEISKLLVERQNKPAATIKQEMPQSNAEELKKYKDLLDGGTITQEEFDAKKRQLLGL